MSILTLENVSFKYEGTKKYVLRDVSASFEKGILYGIVGKSGAGKSTILSLLSGMDLSIDGEIYYDGQSLRTLNRDTYRAKGIGVIFQSYNLLTNATALDNIVLAMEISGSVKTNKKQEALAILESVGIDEEKAKRKVLKLSGGEQQRVGIARALASKADILIADEPTGNLDNETETEILDIFAKFAHEEKKCVIIVTHSQQVAKRMDEVLSLQSGKLKGITL